MLPNLAIGAMRQAFINAFSFARRRNQNCTFIKLYLSLNKAWLALMKLNAHKTQKFYGKTFKVN